MSTSSRQSPSLLIGTRNEGKVREILTILGDIPWWVRSLQEFEDVGIAPEMGETYAENAIAKAQFYARETGLCALADDSGLEVAALDGAPGVYSARYAGANASDADRRRLLLTELAQAPQVNLPQASLPQVNRNARFVCVVAIATPDGTVLNISEGTCAGMIGFESRGDRGFGYDPLFIPDGFDQTFAELSDSIKNRISHRARALLATRAFLVKPREFSILEGALLDPSTGGS